MYVTMETAFNGTTSPMWIPDPADNTTPAELHHYVEGFIAGMVISQAPPDTNEAELQALYPTVRANITGYTTSDVPV